MEREIGQAIFNTESGKQIVGLKSTAYNEYLAARLLFGNGLLTQACIYANSCLEKEIKIYLLVTRTTFPKNTHDTNQLYSILKKNHAKIADKINPEFLKALSKVYQSRYHENLSPGYNFAIYGNKFLAELDYTYMYIEGLTKIETKRDEKKTNLDNDKERKNKILFFRNHILNNISKDDFLKQIDLVYELRILFNHELMEVFYSIDHYDHMEKFLFEALIPSNDNKTYTVTNNYLPSKNLKSS